MKIKKLMWISSIGTMSLSSSLALTGCYFYNFAIKRNDKKFLEKEGFKSVIRDLEVHINWLEQMNPQVFQMTSYDGLNLVATYLKHEQPSKKIAIVLHGFATNHAPMSGAARLFYEKFGFDVLLPDLRGHGDSEGHYIGFGWHDRIDLLGWIDLIIERFGEDVELLLFGVSMGGATVSLASGETLPDNVKLIVSDCAYSNMNSIFGYHLKRKYKLPRFPVITVTSLICRLKAKYSFGEGCVKEQVSKSTTPMLFIHGSEDQFVPTHMAYDLYQSASCEKEILIINGADHAASYQTDSLRYVEALEQSINTYFH